MTADVYLGVSRSVTGRRWRRRGLGSADEDERRALAIAQTLGLPEVIGRLLASRGVAVESAEGFLDPTLRRFLPDPSHLKDLDRAVDRLVKSVRDGERVVVFGDYDVDGATSAALLMRYLRSVGGKVDVYIPDRMVEGYGPNAPALRRLKAEGAAVVVTVDCGITAFQALGSARDIGLDVIVVDHHTAEPALPPALAVVNPNRLDDDSAHGQLAAVGVAFLLVVALNRALRKAGWFDTGGRSEPDALQWLDLVALGTVCDVVPLVGVNRALVAQGLKILAQRRNAGLVALSDVAKISTAPGAYHLGFVLGPRVNAGGRVGRADYGARLLATDDADEARRLAAELDRYNAERKTIEAAVLDAALAEAEIRAARDPILLVAREGWHPGVIGIVAGRLKDRYNRPALAVGIAEGIGKGSGRSVPGVALGPAVIAARQAGLLIDGGGHAMAAGFTVAAERIDDLRRFLIDRLSEAMAAVDPQPTLALDGALAPGAATLELVELVERMGPFGAGNAEPRFAVTAARVAFADVVGDSHVRCALTAGQGARLKAIAFRAAAGELGHALLRSSGAALHVAGHLRLDTYRGRREAQLVIDDAAPAG